MLPWSIFFFVKQSDLKPWLNDFDDCVLFTNLINLMKVLWYSFTILYSILLNCTVLCCIVLYCTVLYCTVQYCTWCSWNDYAVTIQPFSFSLLLSVNIFLFSCFPSTHVLDFNLVCCLILFIRLSSALSWWCLWSHGRCTLHVRTAACVHFFE